MSPTASSAPPERKDDTRWTLGLGVAVAPDFLGSEEYEAQPVPLLDVKYGRFFARTGDGIGLNILETERFTAGVAIDWMKGYDGEDVARGIDDVDDALGARLFVSTRFRGFVGKLEATQAVTESDRGLLVGASLAYPVAASDRLTIIPSLGTQWASEKYMDGYFGIDAGESARSGLRTYAPGSGFRDVTFRLSARYRITESITATGALGVTHLLGDAADSPMVEQETAPVALLGVTYSF
ncbi:MipA/OmpV family protein [Nisaea sediminum]|uniref:MipA/OmpV family protein n=1 Tax=Nisaea sediminum TaxID=2775867 RepID=UPI0029C07440|nr:MipA/OmpV family protein [Nisaea sediminum]